MITANRIRQTFVLNFLITEYKNPSFKYGRMAGGIMGIGTLANKMGESDNVLTRQQKIKLYGYKST